MALINIRNASPHLDATFRNLISSASLHDVKISHSHRARALSSFCVRRIVHTIMTKFSAATVARAKINSC